jgi:hypothetical protein
MTTPLTRDDRSDYWACRSAAGVALLLELEQVEVVGFPFDADCSPVIGEVQAGYRIRGRAVTYHHLGGEENWGTLGIADDLDDRYQAHRVETVRRRAADADAIRRRHPWHHCGDRCPHRTPTEH